MTARCSGGTSSARQGVPETNAVAGGLITEGLTLVSPWLIPFAALVDSFLYQATSQCATDPPAMPSFDASDISNLIGGVLNPNVGTTLQKIKDALLNVLWDRFCKCDNGTVTTTLPIPPPAGVTLNTGGPSQPCFQGTYVGKPPFRNLTDGLFFWPDVTQQMVPTNGLFRGYATGQGTITTYGIPAGITQLTGSRHLPVLQSCGCGTAAGMFVSWFDASNTKIADDNTNSFVTVGSGCDDNFVIPFRPTATYWHVSVDAGVLGGCGTQIEDFRVQMQTWCGGGPGAFSSCCPPDPSVLIGIQNILNAIASLNLQNNPLPSGWIAGERHSGLSGSGSFTLIGDAIGILVDMTTLPVGTAVVPGNPTFYWDAGFLTPIAAGSPLRGWRLVFQHESFALPRFTDSIGYTLEHGTVVNVTELLPVP